MRKSWGHLHSRGVSLAELAVAVFVLQLVVLAVMGIWPGSLSAVQQGKEYLVASGLAEQALENASASGFAALSTQAGLSAQSGPGMVLNSYNNGVPQTQVFNSTVQVYSTSGNAKLLDVVVVVSWTKGGVTSGGITRSLTLETNVASST